MGSLPSIRSALFVPGDRPERFDKALASGADVVIVDLEDAVDESKKHLARDNVERFLVNNPSANIVVRINSSEHNEHESDVELCRQFAQINAVILPKAESRDQVNYLGGRGLNIWPLIETAKGLAALGEIAAGINVQRLSYGALDFGVELGLKSGTVGANRMLDQIRFRLLAETAISGLARPLETVFADITDLEHLQRFAEDALNMGFEGMLCIHPKQVNVVNKAFSPTQEELAWAAEVLKLAHGAAGAFRFQGKMIDAPVLAHARRLSDMAEYYASE